MLRVFQTLYTLLPIVALAILLDASFAIQRVTAKPIPLPHSIVTPNPRPSTGNLRSLRYTRLMASVPEPGDGGHGGTQPSHLLTKHTSEAQARPWMGESISARERHPPKRVSSKGQLSVERLQSGSRIASSSTRARNSPRTSLYKKNIAALRRQRHQLKLSAQKFHRLAARSHLHTNETARQHASHSLQHFYGHAQAAQTTFSQLAAANGTMSAAQNGELEEIIEDVVNVVTQVLSEVTMLTGNIPMLGPELQGIATQIQSLLTNILDTAQGLLDNVLGTLKPIVDAVLPGIV